ncbi:isoprenyl transferase [Sphingosinicella rhizophila]|uniref:Isoprenyl transferase n=1 Tax=Sphingosinicella rhizophila TaxID=3050082 RepID=A0ABU3Q408_9SPHN|nr:isoprenyl transferase [Sphingosinicella sp. GR2756]MDT9597688.1 isoprenyl transferase [Sphingosinicella sp. GR2756]
MNSVPASAAPRPENGGAEGGNIPRHVAIIMDGNGRWAKARGLPRVAGHKQGAEAARKVLRAAGTAGVECLTLYAFSSENWRRPQDEINDLMGLLSLYISRELDALHAEGVRIKIIGDHSAFKSDVARLIDKAVDKTASNQRMTLAVALNYGAQREIVHAVRSLARKVEAGQLSPDTIGEAEIEAELDTRDLPPLDLLIRTSGEHRLSNFLLWQSAYSELLFTDTLWPDFDGDAFRAALAAYGARERRFGGR